MNSALYQELINPSKFNLIAALTLIVLIIVSLIAITVTLFNKQEKEGKSSTPSSEESGKGF